MDLDRRFPIAPGDRVLDLGCGAGRHSFELLRRGAHVTAVDHDAEALGAVRAMFDAMDAEGEVPQGGTGETVVGDALALPFPDAHFDGVLVSEVLEHIPEDTAAMAEIARVVRPGGMVAVSVPRYGPERVCWALSDAYHANEGGHVRIYTRRQLIGRLESTGLRTTATHHAHALHAPYWWLKCAVGVHRDAALPVRAYHSMLVWDMVKAPALTRIAEAALDPIIGKSVVVYLVKPEPVDAAA